MGPLALKPSAEYLLEKLEKLSPTARFRCFILLLLFLDLLLITETVVRTAPMPQCLGVTCLFTPVQKLHLVEGIKPYPKIMDSHECMHVKAELKGYNLH